MARHNFLTNEERSWVLYDVANSAFTLIVVTTFMPIFFKDYVSSGMDTAASTAAWAFTVSIASLCLALISPVLGALADYKGYKKKFWAWSIMVGAAAASCLALVGKDQRLFATVVYVLAVIAYTASNTFYDSFLPDVTTPDRMDLLSSIGFGWGYIGSVVPFVLTLGIIALLGFSPEGAIPAAGMKISFVIAAAWWGLFSIPMARAVTQKYGIPSEGMRIREAMGGAFRRLLTTLKDAKLHKPVWMFLLAYFFYIDGVHTIISTASAYGRDLGLSAAFLVILILFIQIVAWPFAIAFGRGAAKYGRKPLIFVAIGVYAAVCFIAFYIPALPTMRAKTLLFWVMAFLIASSQGGIQALSRSYFALLIPPEKSAEYFGFYDVFGKFAAILGPFLLGLMTTLTGQSRWGILSLSILFVIGGCILAFVPAAEKRS